MKILIMKFRNIGDTLLATPLAANLRLAYPQAQIHFACNEGCEAMLEGNANIDKIHIYRRASAKNSGFLKRIKTELDFLAKLKSEHFDIAINATEGDRGAYLAFLSGAKTRIGFDRGSFASRLLTHKVAQNCDIFGSHTIEHDLALLSALGLTPYTKTISIAFDDYSEFFADKLPASFIHFHPMSRWLFKCPKDEIIADLLDFCELELGVKCVMTCANDEKEIARCENILRLAKSKPSAFLGNLSLKQVAFLSSKARLFVGVDTAVMHMAAAVNTPVVALFGPSSAMNWGPWDNTCANSGYKAKNGIQHMGAHSVVQASWECVPCSCDGCNGSKKSRCLDEINTSAIKELIKAKLERAKHS